jgi:glutamate-1-semialdehyde 2,1-aminomutase
MRSLTNTHTVRSVEELKERAHRLIPAGAHTYSKGDDQFPSNAPAFIARGKGATVWDTEGKEYLDWGMGLRSVVLGHAYPRVVEAVREQIALGSNFVRPSPLEADLAEMLVEMIPGADMVKFAKNGSDVTTAALRLARAHTGRDLVAICSDNPFYSFDDWFIGTTECNAGVPDVIARMTLKFSYGDTARLEALFREYPGQIGCVMVEPAATAPPVNRGGCLRCASWRSGRGEPLHSEDCRNRTFLQAVVEIAHRHGAVAVFDELITGFRFDTPGAQSLYGVVPDMSTFGKAMANGFSVSALVGHREIMELGGTRHCDRPKVFLLSATHGGETHAIAATIATIREMLDEPVIRHVWRVGEAFQRAINEAAAKADLSEHVRCDGYPPSPLLSFVGLDRQPSAELRTLFLQEMVAQGILLPYVAPSYSHTLDDVDRTAEAAQGALNVCRRAFDEGFARYLRGPASKPVFRRFN